MADSIYKKTHDYMQDLKETKEVTAYRKAVKEFKSDSEAYKLLQDFQESQQTYAVLRQGNFPGLETQAQKVKELQGMVSKNTKIQTLIKTQQELESFVGALARTISQGINFPFTEPQRGGCCG